MLRPGRKFYRRPSLPVVAIVVLTALLTVPTTVVLTVRAENQPPTDIAGATPIFGNPTNLGPTVNSSYSEWDPDISSDGLSLYFLSGRPGGFGRSDIWVTTRKTKDDPWGPPVNLGPKVNTSAFEGAPCISADGLELYFVSDRPGGSGDNDLWVTMRKTKGDSWSAPVNLGSTVNSSATENGPNISIDGLSLYFTSRRPGGLGRTDIWVTTRKTKDDHWETPVNLGPMVNSSNGEDCPSISTDGLSLYFGSNRTGGFGGNDFWVTMRKTKDEPWSTPINLGPTVNTPHNEYDVDISSDGSTLYFVSDRPGSVGGSVNVDIWQVSLKAQGQKE